MSRARPGVVALAAAVLLRVASARAEGTSVLELSVEQCPGLDAPRLRELLVIELGTVRPSGADDVDVHLVCTGTRVAMDLRDRALGRSWRADVDLAGTPEATRLRLLVLAVTEQWALPRAADAPPAAAPERAPVTDAPVVASAPSAPAAPPRWRLTAKGVAREAGKPGLWLGGVGVGVERALARHLGLALDLAGEEGGVDVSVASVTVRDLVATAGVLVSAEVGRWSLGAVPAFSVGLASLAGTPRLAGAQGATLTAAWSGPVLALRARRALGRAASIVAEAGAGFTTRRVTGLVDDRATIFELRGPWVQVGLGAGWAF